MDEATAPELETLRWFNVEAPITLAELRGRVVAIEAFQMLCPGCVSHGLPQAQRLAETFRREDVAVLGLHSVFEHYAAQGTGEALAAFLQEYRIAFPVAIDRPSEGQAMPRTMAAYGLRGTPTLVLIDKRGRRRAQYFGHVPDIALGAEVMALCREEGPAAASAESVPAVGTSPALCDESGCPAP